MKITQETKLKNSPDTTGSSRDEQGKFKAGVSGNPDGRPKGSGLCLTSLLKEYLEKIPEGQKVPYKNLFIKKLLKKALVDNDIQALKLIINYVDGLPKQILENTGEIKHTHSNDLENYKKAQDIAKKYEKELYKSLNKKK